VSSCTFIVYFREALSTPRSEKGRREKGKIQEIIINESTIPNPDEERGILIK